MKFSKRRTNPLPQYESIYKVDTLALCELPTLEATYQALRGDYGSGSNHQYCYEIWRNLQKRFT